MGLRDRLKRRLGKPRDTPAPARADEPPRQRGPVRSRIDLAQERDAALVAPEPAAPGAGVLDDGFFDAVAAGQPAAASAPAVVNYDEHPVQHAVSVTNPETGEVLHFTAAPGETVLDAADRRGLELPSSCRAGGCLSCSGKRLTGTVTLDEQFVLEQEHLDAGFVLLCGTRVHGPATFLSHQQEAID